MSLRLTTQHLLRSTRAQLTARPIARPIARLASTSNLPNELKIDISKEATLTHADPLADSQSAALVSQHLPYMVATYDRPLPVFIKGKGAYLYDIENRRYIDFTAGIAVNALGHNDEQLANLIYDQAQQLIHASNLYHNPWTGELSKLLVERTKKAGGFHDAARAFLCNSGTEANEAAIKFARKVGKTFSTSKIEVVSFRNSFHGRTMGSLSATPNPKYQAPFAPMLPGFKYGEFNDVAGIEKLVNESTCGVIVEPIQGEGGVYVGSTEFLLALRRRCTEVGAVLIYDEIQCGIGRTGELWAHQHLPKAAHPDVLTMAKALGNGFPIGAVLVNEKVASKIVTGDHGTTYGGNPLASRIGHYVFSRISAPAFLAEVKEKEKVFARELKKLQERFPEQVGAVRGRGLLLGLQMSENPSEIVKAARERGLLVITAGNNTIRFVPPLIIEEATIEEGMRILGEAMESVLSKK